MSNKAILIGLAGKSCAGKNEVGKILEKYGWNVIDADSISRFIFSQQQEEIHALFIDEARKKGVKIENEHGLLDKKRLSSFLFKHKELLAKMEDFILPIIVKKIEEEIDYIVENNENPRIVLNAPTLHKTVLLERCSYIIYVKSNFFIRLLRAIKRDGFSPINICRRFLNQTDFFTQYITKKTDILPIANNSGLRKLQESVRTALISVDLLK
ncbi:MAG: dephospho-CoA kinase [Treponema sp.]